MLDEQAGKVYLAEAAESWQPDQGLRALVATDHANWLEPQAALRTHLLDQRTTRVSCADQQDAFGRHHTQEPCSRQGAAGEHEREGRSSEDYDCGKRQLARCYHREPARQQQAPQQQTVEDGWQVVE